MSVRKEVWPRYVLSTEYAPCDPGGREVLKATYIDQSSQAVPVLGCKHGNATHRRRVDLTRVCGKRLHGASAGDGVGLACGCSSFLIVISGYGWIICWSLSIPRLFSLPGSTPLPAPNPGDKSFEQIFLPCSSEHESLLGMES